MRPALIVDTDDIVLGSNGSESGRCIQDNPEMMQISAAPAIVASARRVGILLQNISGTKMIYPDLENSRPMSPTVDFADDIPLAHHPN
jgi:hypothetical protein